MLQWWSLFPDLLALLFRFLRLSYGCHQNPEGGEKDELFIEQLKLWLTLADSLYDVGRTLHFRCLQSSRALEKSLLTPVDPKKPLLWETNSSSLSIIIAYHHNTPLFSLNYNNKSLRAWENSALWAFFFGPEFYWVTRLNPKTRTHPCRTADGIQKHSRTSWTFTNTTTPQRFPQEQGSSDFVVKNLHHWKIVLLISYRHLIS